MLSSFIEAITAAARYVSSLPEGGGSSSSSSAAAHSQAVRAETGCLSLLRSVHVKLEAVEDALPAGAPPAVPRAPFPAAVGLSNTLFFLLLKARMRSAESFQDHPSPILIPSSLFRRKGSGGT